MANRGAKLNLVSHLHHEPKIKLTDEQKCADRTIYHKHHHRREEQFFAFETRQMAGNGTSRVLQFGYTKP